MANPIESTPRAPFSRLPRRRGLSGAAIVTVWISLCGAFAAEIFPMGSPVDRLYELEAARDGFVRAAHARDVLAGVTDARPPVAGRAAHPRRRTSQSTSVTAIETRMDVASGR